MSGHTLEGMPEEKRYPALASSGITKPYADELASRFGLLGPTRVQIPPPPLLTSAGSARWQSLPGSPCS
jgi:hypothetical protein